LSVFHTIDQFAVDIQRLSTKVTEAASDAEW